MRTAVKQNDSPAEPKWWTAAEIAWEYRVSARAVLAWKESGKIPCIQIGKTVRFDREAVRKIIEKGGDES